MADTLPRARNAVRRLLAGLPLRNAPSSPTVPDQVHRTLASLYRFAAGHVDGASVLDWGCGTGFGAPRLMDGGARSVLGTDPDAKAIRYAEKRFAGDGVSFREAPLETPVGEGETFERLVAIEVLSRLSDPEAVLPQVLAHLEPHGTMAASLPPILDGPTLEIHRARHPQAPRMFLWDWADLLGELFEEISLYSHQPPDGVRLELASPHPSHLDEAAFRFDPIPVDDLDNVGTLGAVFVCGRLRG